MEHHYNGAEDGAEDDSGRVGVVVKLKAMFKAVQLAGPLQQASALTKR